MGVHRSPPPPSWCLNPNTELITPSMEAPPPLFSIPVDYEQAHHHARFSHPTLYYHTSTITHVVAPDGQYMGYHNGENPRAGFSQVGQADPPLPQSSFMGLEQVLPVVYRQEDPSRKGIRIRDEVMEDNSLTDLLLTAAEAVETDNRHLALPAIARLHSLLLDGENGSDPFHRLAYYFTQGLRSRITGSYPTSPAGHVPTNNINMSAYQMVQELTPYVKFAHFAANQAILEATADDREIHVVDFNVGEGIQWPPLMVDLSQREGALLRITAVVADGNVDAARQTGRRLVEFGESIGLALRFDHLVVENEGDLEQFEASKGKLIVNCVSMQCLLTFVRKLSPKMVVLVEEEPFVSCKNPCKSFVEFFCEALHHFSSHLDSLVHSFCGEYRVGLRLVEREMLEPRVVDCVRRYRCGEESKGWGGGGALLLEGYKVDSLSACNVSQAKFLVGLFGGGYQVHHEEGWLALCWKSRPLTTISVWVK